LWEIGLTSAREGRAVSCEEKVMGSWHLNPEPKGYKKFGSFIVYLKYMLKITL